jgi:hypothetical protein
MPIEKVNWDKQDVVSCDERGRATLGKEFADEQVFVWVARPDYGEGERVSDEEQKVLNKMVSWASDNVDEYFDLDPHTGIVTDKWGEEHQSPFSLEDDES